MYLLEVKTLIWPHNIFIWDIVLWQIKPRLGVFAEVLQHLFTNFFQLHNLLLGETFFSALLVYHCDIAIIIPAL